MAKRYVVQSPVEHNQKRFDVGAPISLEDEAALPMLAVGAIIEAEAEEPKSKK